MAGAVGLEAPVSPLAGRHPSKEMAVNPAALEWEYFSRLPDPDAIRELASFGTGEHSGSPLKGTFTEAHVLAIVQAICDYRRSRAVEGPLYMGKDTHALSGTAQDTALEVLAANGVPTIIQRGGGVTPAPAISRAILAYNRNRTDRLADGIVLAPWQHLPEEGGIRYIAHDGGPAGLGTGRWIENRANALLRRRNAGLKRQPLTQALKAETTHRTDMLPPYVRELGAILDMDAIRGAGLRLGVDPMGGAALPYWEAIAATYSLEVSIVNSRVDPAFLFMRLDRDGRIRMDCSSPYVMAGLIEDRKAFHVAFGNDPDAGRYGIVTPSAGLLGPNEYLPVAIRYLLTNRPKWPAQACVGKTFVTSSTIDRVAGKLGRQVYEVPVGFKWFAQNLLDGGCGVAGEENGAGSFLQRDGSVWTTSEDGLVMSLLGAEILARTGRDPGEHYRLLAADIGRPHYMQIDCPATPEQRARLAGLSENAVKAPVMAGELIVAKLTRACGNNARLHGLKVVTSGGWFAVCPSANEDLCKIYAESFTGEQYLEAMVDEARQTVNRLLHRPADAGLSGTAGGGGSRWPH